jgi:hypothetical protein
MHNILDSYRLDQALGLLSERLSLAQAPIYELIVCGGSALIARGLVSRVTRDVDVVARREPGGLVSSQPLPAALLAAAERVEADLGLAPKWLNSGLDQIHFKLYAAADQGPGRHVDDLIALRPTSDELLAAARWAFSHDVSEGFRATVRDMLIKLGHASVAAQL